MRRTSARMRFPRANEWQRSDQAPGATLMPRLYDAALNSLRGLNSAAKSEAALRQELAALLLSFVVAPFVAPNVAWAIAMIGVILFILIIELLNTAIEKFADHVTPERHVTIGMIKDIGSAAVLCALALGALVWTAALALRFGLV